jgi:hypothetical protein
MRLSPRILLISISAGRGGRVPGLGLVTLGVLQKNTMLVKAIPPAPLQ